MQRLTKVLWPWLEGQVFTLPSLDGERPLFNFYHDEVAGIDRLGAASLRRENLCAYLDSFEEMPAVLAVGEAPGWRGCRLTGIPFTSETLLALGRLPYSGRRASCLDQHHPEVTATLFQRAVNAWIEDLPDMPVFAWNCIPLHPHLPGQPLTNRSPSPAEIRLFRPMLCELVQRLNPRLVLAIGRCAQAALRDAGISACPVRHPSHGGAQRFLQDMETARLLFKI